MKNNSSWVVGVVAIVLILIGVVRISTYIKGGQNPEMPQEKMFKAMASDPTSYALAEEAAKAAIRLCGENGGNVVLVIPEIKEIYRNSFGAAYEDGLKEGLKLDPSVELDGIYFAAPPYGGNKFRDQRPPIMERLQDIRRVYPKSDVIVSFLGLPQLTTQEKQDWMASNPPRMVVVEPYYLADRNSAKAALKSGLIDTLIVNRSPVELPETLDNAEEEAAKHHTPQFDVMLPETD